MFRIQATQDKGYGLVANKDLDGELGEYAGFITKKDEANKSNYLIDIPIGRIASKEVALGAIDGERAGSVLRIMNSSCNPNIELDDVAVRLNRRILYARRIRPIKKGDPVVVAYGKDWFVDGKFCNCGEPGCQFPEPAFTESESLIKVHADTSTLVPKQSVVTSGEISENVHEKCQVSLSIRSSKGSRISTQLPIGNNPKSKEETTESSTNITAESDQPRITQPPADDTSSDIAPARHQPSKSAPTRQFTDEAFKISFEQSQTKVENFDDSDEADIVDLLTEEVLGERLPWNESKRRR